MTEKEWAAFRKQLEQKGISHSDRKGSERAKRVERELKTRPKYKIDPYSEIFFPGIPRTFKSAKKCTCKDNKTGRLLGKPRTYYPAVNEKWFKDMAPTILSKYSLWQMLTKDLHYPYHVLVRLVLPKKQRCDLGNMTEALWDAMSLSAYKATPSRTAGIPLEAMKAWIEDDDYTRLIPYFGPTYIDRDNPGIIVRPLENPPDYGFKVW